MGLEQFCRISEILMYVGLAMGLLAFIRTLLARVRGSGPLPGQATLYRAGLVCFVIGATFFGMTYDFVAVGNVERDRRKGSDGVAVEKVRPSVVSPTEKESSEK